MADIYHFVVYRGGDNNPFPPEADVMRLQIQVVVSAEETTAYGRIVMQYREVIDLACNTVLDGPEHMLI